MMGWGGDGGMGWRWRWWDGVEVEMVGWDGGGDDGVEVVGWGGDGGMGRRWR